MIGTRAAATNTMSRWAVAGAILRLVVLAGFSVIAVFVAGQALLCDHVRALPEFSPDRSYYAQVDSCSCGMFGGRTTRVILTERSTVGVILASNNTTVMRGDMSLDAVSLEWRDETTLLVELANDQQVGDAERVTHWREVTIVFQARDG